MTYDMFLTMFCSILGSSAVFGFIQFIINRRDSRNEQLSAIKQELASLKTDISKLHDDVEMTLAINARIRILDCSDQIRRHVKHSHEYFIQINDDITSYNKYCEHHPDFKNNRAVHAIENINRVYSELLKTDEFL